MKTKGSWKIQNLKGVERMFKDAEHPDAIAWMSNRDDKVPKIEKPPKKKPGCDSC